MNFSKYDALGHAPLPLPVLLFIFFSPFSNCNFVIKDYIHKKKKKKKIKIFPNPLN